MSALGLGGLAAIPVARWTAKLPGRFAVALHGASATLGAGIAYVCLPAPTPKLTTSTAATAILGVGQFRLLGRAQGVGAETPARAATNGETVA